MSWRGKMLRIRVGVVDAAAECHRRLVAASSGFLALFGPADPAASAPCARRAHQGPPSPADRPLRTASPCRGRHRGHLSSSIDGFWRGADQAPEVDQRRLRAGSRLDELRSFAASAAPRSRRLRSARTRPTSNRWRASFNCASARADRLFEHPHRFAGGGHAPSRRARSRTAGRRGRCRCRRRRPAPRRVAARSSASVRPDV